VNNAGASPTVPRLPDLGRVDHDIALAHMAHGQTEELIFIGNGGNNGHYENGARQIDVDGELTIEAKIAELQRAIGLSVAVEDDGSKLHVKELEMQFHNAHAGGAALRVNSANRFRGANAVDGVFESSRPVFDGGSSSASVISSNGGRIEPLLSGLSTSVSGQSGTQSLSSRSSSPASSGRNSYSPASSGRNVPSPPPFNPSMLGVDGMDGSIKPLVYGDRLV
jgi:hypothetical protein